MKAHLVETCTADRKSNLSPFFDKNKEILCSFFLSCHFFTILHVVIITVMVY